MFNYGVVDEIIDKIVLNFSPKMIIVFGSVASHSADSDSDLDLLIVMDTAAPRFYRTIPIDICLRKFTVDKDIHVVTPDEFEAGKDDEYSFISEIVKTGYVAYEA